MGFFQWDRKNDERVQVVYRSDYLWPLWHRTFLAETPLQRDNVGSSPVIDLGEGFRYAR